MSDSVKNEPNKSLKTWWIALRMPFLTLSTIPALLGALMAWYDGYINFGLAIITVVGVGSIHASANVLNDYFDYRSGIDVSTAPTKFSGGSRVLPNGLLKPDKVLYAGMLLLAFGVGLGFLILYALRFDLVILGFMVVTVLATVIYSPVMSRYGAGEITVGLGLGPLPLLGSYYIQTHAISWGPIVASLVVGIMGGSVLYINEFPDYDADSSRGRRNASIMFGRERAAKLFLPITIIGYMLIPIGIIAGVLSSFTIISFATIPLVVKASKVLRLHYARPSELVEGMALMVGGATWTALLLTLAYVGEISLHYLVT